MKKSVFLVKMQEKTLYNTKYNTMYNMKTVTRTRKIGGSLVVTIPKEIVKEETLVEGELVEINVEKIKKDFFGVLKGIGRMTKEDELDTHE